jgi:hypothetical protein
MSSGISEKDARFLKGGQLCVTRGRSDDTRLYTGCMLPRGYRERINTSFCITKQLPVGFGSVSQSYNIIRGPTVIHVLLQLRSICHGLSASAQKVSILPSPLARALALRISNSGKTGPDPQRTTVTAKNFYCNPEDF